MTYYFFKTANAKQSTQKNNVCFPDEDTLCVRLPDSFEYVTDDDDIEDYDEERTTSDLETSNEQSGPGKRIIRNYFCNGHLVQCLFQCFEDYSTHTCGGKSNTNGQIPPSGAGSARRITLNEVAFVAIKMGRLNAYTYFRFGF